MKIFDYHTHTYYSVDSEEKMENMIKSAISKGVYELAFTDHMDYDDRYPVTNYDDYVVEFNSLKENYKDKINLLFGIEIGLDHRFKEDIKELTKKYPFDFIIGSSHLVNGLDLYFDDFFQDKSKDESVEEYLLSVYKNIEYIDDFCVYGHLDFLTRYMPYEEKTMNYKDYSDLFDSILKLLIKKDKGLEINTSGFRYGIDICYPKIEILKRYKQLGGKIVTIGSDSHSVAYIANHFTDALELLKASGFDTITRFKNRTPYFEKI